MDYPDECVLPVSYETVHKCMFEYFDWLCYKLSKNGLVAKQSIYAKLQEKCVDSCR